MKAPFYLLIFLSLFIILAFTNPTREEHVNKLKEIIGIELRKNSKPGLFESPDKVEENQKFSEQLEKFFFELLEPQLIYTSYLFWSTSEISDKESKKPIGKALGILNNVVIVYYNESKSN
jgi:hypothetical protein